MPATQEPGSSQNTPFGVVRTTKSLRSLDRASYLRDSSIVKRDRTVDDFRFGLLGLDEDAEAEGAGAGAPSWFGVTCRRQARTCLVTWRAATPEEIRAGSARTP
jgi:hypothetical protein